MRNFLGLLALAPILASTVALGAVSFDGTPYSQDFNGLPGSGAVTIANKGPLDLSSNSTSTGVGALAGTNITNWYIANPSGSSSSTEYRAQDGSLSGSSGRGVVSYGTTGSSDRALGTLSTSNQISTFGLILSNATSTPITSATVSFTGEQWRRGDPLVHDTLLFHYALSSVPTDNISSALTFTHVATLDFAAVNILDGTSDTNKALNGNDPANQAPVSATLSNLNWNPGDILILRWSAQDLTGQDDGLAIDDLTVSVPEPAALGILGLGAVALMRRRQRG